jgi:hypothetical protein
MLLAKSVTTFPFSISENERWKLSMCKDKTLRDLTWICCSSNFHINKMEYSEINLGVLH